MKKVAKKQFTLIHIDRIIIGGEDMPPNGGSVRLWVIIIGLWKVLSG